MTRTVLAVVALMVAVVAGASASTTGLSPNEIVERTAQTLADRIDGRAAQLSANPKELYALVDEVFLPVFDTDYAGRLVLGKHWRTATPDQRQQFVSAFYDFLLRSYSRYVVRFEKDKVKILPPGKQTNPDRAVVRTEMTLEDGTRIPVNYSLYQTPQGWKAYDVRIEGISYVQNYRNQFNAEISAKGIDAVIARLRADAVKLESGQAAGAAPAGGKPR